jgi:hypothetical protein
MDGGGVVVFPPSLCDFQPPQSLTSHNKIYVCHPVLENFPLKFQTNVIFCFFCLDAKETKNQGSASRRPGYEAKA